MFVNMANGKNSVYEQIPLGYVPDKTLGVITPEWEVIHLKSVNVQVAKVMCIMKPASSFGEYHFPYPKMRQI